MTTWSRSGALAEVSDRLWRYLSAAATPEAASGAAEGLWKLSPGDMRRLVATRICTSDAAGRMLDAVEALLPRLSANTRLTEEEVIGRVTGPIDWRGTRRLQTASGDRTRFVCLPVSRHFDSPLGRLIVFALTKCQVMCDAAQLVGSPGQTDLIIEEVRKRSARLIQHTKLRGVPPHLGNRRHLTTLQRRRGVAPIIEFAALYLDSYEALEFPVVKQVVEDQLLAPLEDDRLFELQVGFRLVTAFELCGFTSHPPTLIEPGSPAPLALLERDGQRVRIWWQRSALHLMGLDSGLYKDALTGAGLKASALLPDLTIEFPSTQRFVLVEVKHTATDRAPVHAGVKDSLLYLVDAKEHFAHQPFPHAAVAALGAAAGSLDGRIIVTGGESEQLNPLAGRIIEAHSSD